MTLGKKKWILTATLLLATLLVSTTDSVWAQSNSTESPYTRFGYGTLSSYSSTLSRAMGGVSIATRRSNLINPGNPASYVAVDSQTFIFDFATSFGFSHITDGKLKDTRLLGNLEYISILFPITKWMVVSAGLKPYSTVGYRYGSTKDIALNGGKQYNETYSGRGNVNDIYIGVAATPFKGFSMGANVAYRYGTISYQQAIEYQVAGSFNPHFSERLKLMGLGIEAGIQQGFSLGEEQQMTLGVTYSPSLPFASNLYKRGVMMNSNKLGGVIQNDTISSKNSYKTPHAIGVGVSYARGERFFVEGDVHYRIWQNAFPQTALYTPRNQFEVALGASFVPNPQERALHKRMEYRFGLRGGNSYLTIPIDGVQRSYYEAGASFGLGFPLADRRSTLDVSIDYKLLLPEGKQLITEHYLMLTVGVRFNEGWFKKLQLD